jgi:hypothetical protein
MVVTFSRGGRAADCTLAQTAAGSGLSVAAAGSVTWQLSVGCVADVHVLVGAPTTTVQLLEWFHF